MDVNHEELRMRGGMLALALAVAAPGALAAQEPRDSATVLRPIVVTATRLPTPADHVPASVTVLDGDSLRARGLTSVAEALRAVAGASIVRSGPPGALTSLYLRGGESDYVRVLVDGVPVNGPGGTLNLADLTLDDVDRIEVVAGPASVLYGSDAMSGVVQVFTRRGGSHGRYEAGLRGGSADTRLAQAALAAGSRLVGVSVAASASGTDGVWDLNSRYRNEAVQAGLRLQAGARSDLSVAVRSTRGRLAFPTDFTGLPGDSNQSSESRLTTVGADGGVRISSLLEARALVTWQRGEDAYDNPPDTAPGNFAYHSRTRFDRRSVDLRANLTPTPRATFTIGAALESQRAGSRDSAGSAAFGYATTATELERDTRGLYAQLLAAVHGLVTVSGGARWEENGLYGSFVTWRSGASWRALSGTRVHASVGTAFKEPAPHEVLPSAFSVGNARLDPERSRSIEIGVTQRVKGDRVELRAALFDQRFRDMVQYVPAFPSPGSYRNLGAAEARGLELAGRAAVWDGAGVGVRYTLLHTAVTDSGNGGDPSFEQGRPLLRRPRHGGSVSADLRLGERASALLSLLLVGRRQDVDPVRSARVEVPGHSRLDLSVGFEALRAARSRPGISVLVRVENLMGTGYEEARGYPAPGRRATVELRLESGR